MSSLIEISANLVTLQASKAPMSVDQILSEISRVHKGLTDLESGKQVNIAGEVKPTISNKEAFKKTEVVCMVCGKGGFKTLSRHLHTAHGMKPTEYRKEFGIPRTQSLTAKTYSQARRKSALERGLADNLAKAREVRRANIEAERATVVVEESQFVEVAEVAVATGI